MHILTLVLAALGIGLTPTALACPGIDHAHGLAPRSAKGSKQPSGGTGLLRELKWGEINILHTTDIHGWYQGHMKSSEPEPNYSGDWGDFASFVYHMRREAKKKGVDLLVVDTGDLHDGNGLSDGFPPGGIDGNVSNQIFSMIQYDSLTIGNHELYIYNITKDVYDNFVPQHKGRYLSSNVNITIPSKDGSGNVSVPVGDRFAKFKTEMGRKITALGVLFNFTGNDAGTTVQDPAQMVKEQWFKEAIQEEPDVFLLTGHMPVRRDQFPVIFDAIRAVHPNTPILVLGGHSHIRDCVQYDGRSMALESGRYLETIGFMSASGLKSKDATQNLTLSRSYIDANRRNYAFHAGLTEKKLDTRKGVKITAEMAHIADDWNLTQVYGKAPQDYFLNRVPANDSSSLINLLQNKVLPSVISTSNPARNGTPNIVIANSGSQRFDVYAGDFTKNDEYIVSPFLDAFLYIPDVPWKYAKQIGGALNGDYVAQGSSKRSDEAGEEERQRAQLERREQERAMYAKGEVQHLFNAWMRTQNEAAKEDLRTLDMRAQEQKTLGYVTKDSCPGVGDDTQHTPIPYVDYPDYVTSPLSPPSSASNATDSTPVDVIMVDFIASQVVRILNRLQSDKTYTVQDAQEYNKLTTQDLYPLYAKEAWNQVQGPSTAALRGAERWTRRGAHLCNYASNICA